MFEIIYRFGVTEQKVINQTPEDLHRQLPELKSEIFKNFGFTQIQMIGEKTTIIINKVE